MNPLISNLLMQPRPTNAVERPEHPQTLIEKLGEHQDTIAILRSTEKQGSHAFNFLGHHLLGIQKAIDIVKQHSDWVPVSERLPSDKSVVLCYGIPYEWDKTSKPNSNIFCAVYVAEYDRWSEGYSAFGDTSTLKITHWQSLPQPPSEVQA